jgi:hypothetical protein
MMDNAAIREKSVFVRIDEYKEVISLFDNVRSQLDKTKSILGKIKELKAEEQTEIELWNKSIMEIEKKLEFIDKTMNDSEA